MAHFVIPLFDSVGQGVVKILNYLSVIMSNLFWFLIAATVLEITVYSEILGGVLKIHYGLVKAA